MSLKEIREFKGDYRFLSNFFPDGLTPGDTVEHRFQALKTLDESERLLVLEAASPGKAKRLGKSVTLREDWEDVKISVMLELVREKFKVPYLAGLLDMTGKANLYEGNSWGDTFWGIDLETGKGQNNLGLILMQVRWENRNPLSSGDGVY